MKGLGNKAIMSRNLRRLMREKDVTPKEMSAKLEIPYTTLLSWMKADNYPRIDKIEAMAEYFGVMKSDLIEEKLPQEMETPAGDDGLTEGMQTLIDYVRANVPEDKAAMALRVLRSIVEDDQ